MHIRAVSPNTLVVVGAAGKPHTTSRWRHGSSNIDVNLSVGSIFSILRAPNPGTDPKPEDYLQPGCKQVCAGYAIYGPSTMLVLSVGTGVHAFTLDRAFGEFILTRASIQYPPGRQRIRDQRLQPAILGARGTALRRRVPGGPLRAASQGLQDALGRLTRGRDSPDFLPPGEECFLYPWDSKDPTKAGKLRLLDEANPMSFLIEQAGGLASTGRQRMLDVVPDSLHQRIAFVFGASEEVQRIQKYHSENNEPADVSPLYAARGLFLSPPTERREHVP